MIHFKRAGTATELQQILLLQANNRSQALSRDETKQEGFVTVEHSFELLQKMNLACPHIIVKSENQVIGYALAMTREFRDEIPLLHPMFAMADTHLSDKNYLAMGQICIAKDFRKKGIFRGMYQFYKQELKHAYDGLLTGVATDNQRSFQAHKSVGFVTLRTHMTADVSWELMYWGWKP